MKNNNDNVFVKFDSTLVYDHTTMAFAPFHFCTFGSDKKEMEQVYFGDN